MPTRIETERLAFDATGAPFSARYGDVYASRDGALAQARHVFLGGNDLPARWRDRAQFTIVETGFGLGINFLATWQAWRDDPRRCGRLHFVSVELHPLAAGDVAAAAPAELRPLARELAARWPLPLPGLHRLEFESGRLVLTLALGDVREVVPQLVCGADAFYLDGFAPIRNPQMWEPASIRALARLARPAATLATWTTARAVRDALAASGFELAVRAGFGRKREMLTARFAPRWKMRRHEPAAPHEGERRALVIGAGLAGCHVAAALARRGWRIALLERMPAPARGASGLPWGLLHPQIAADDSVLARLTRAGFLLARARLADTDAALWHDGGVFRQARDDAEAAAWRAALTVLGFPSEYAAWIDAGEAAARLGVRPGRGGLWFPLGAVVSARRWCERLLAEGAAIEARYDCAVQRLACDGGEWIVLDGAGRARAAAPVVVVAAALEAPTLLGLRHAPVQAVRGRVSLLAADDLARLRAGLAGDGSFVRGTDGALCVGATYEPAPTEAGADDDARAHAGNLQRLARLLAEPVAPAIVGVFDGARCVARDRLPLAGAIADEAAALAAAASLRGAHLQDLPRRPGLYGAFALGSRGLTLAPLAAELVAAQIEGEPWPIERALAAALDPARFLLQRLRRARLDDLAAPAVL
ncbi:MAG: bifunctional tRNA (5-methylaminomethyl-2-thiouridine)(34)-methyltransferase MnmD/FAD-dependent 5-carboxymethylaminomethyl-2-thiouridine(34) oxidoreductase MnmC [Burkholderiaceae bacterium]